MMLAGFDLRRIQVVALAVMIAAAGLLGVAGLATGESRWLGPAAFFAVASAGPAVCIAAGLHPSSAAIWVAVAIGFGQRTVGIPETELPAGVALIAIGVVLLGAFVPRRLQYATAAGWAIGLALVPIWWSGAGALPVGLGLAAGFLALFAVNAELRDVQHAIRQERAHSYAVLDRSGAPILELDFSAIEDDLRRIGSSDGRFRETLIEDPDLVNRLFGEVRATAMNEAARTELAAGDLDLPVQPAAGGPQPENLRAVTDWLASLASGATSWEGALMVGGVDGSSHWYACRHIVPAEVQGLDRTYLTLVDISEAKALQAELDNAQSEFIATISHELRTPLAAVVGFSAELADHPDDYDSETMAEMLRLIHRQSREISYIVDDLMAASSAEIGSMKVVPEPFDVRAAVDQVVEVTGSDLDVVGGSDRLGYADPIRFAQIVRNLITNVERYGGNRARIEIGETDAGVAVEVIDNGPGMPEDRAEQIFRANGKVPSSQVIGSMGLGLHVSRSLAEMMGSELTYDRRGGESRFRVVIPAVAES